MVAQFFNYDFRTFLRFSWQFGWDKHYHFASTDTQDHHIYGYGKTIYMIQKFWALIRTYKFWIHIYHVSIFVQGKLEFLISFFVGCIVFCNLMLVFHEDLHAELLFYFRSIFLPMFKLECKQIVCWTLMRKKKTNTIFFQIHSICFLENQSCQYGIKLHNSVPYDMPEYDFKAISESNTGNLIGWFICNNTTWTTEAIHPSMIQHCTVECERPPYLMGSRATIRKSI